MPVEDVQVPIYVDAGIEEYLIQKCGGIAGGLQTLVNDLLRKDIEIAKRVA